MVTLSLSIDIDPIFFKCQPKIGIFNNSFFNIKTGFLKIACKKNVSNNDWWRDAIKYGEDLGFYDKILSTTTNSSRPVIIFPQASRTPIDDKTPFKKGVSKIYEKLNFICVPVALNSGDVWPKSGKLKSNKTITISILNQIPAGLKVDDFQKKIELDLYEELENIR